ncbi:hypothetical protein DAPPUDRAFT_339171, partial [Daphnia pulex]
MHIEEEGTAHRDIGSAARGARHVGRDATDARGGQVVAEAFGQGGCLAIAAVGGGVLDDDGAEHIADAVVARGQHERHGLRAVVGGHDPGRSHDGFAAHGDAHMGASACCGGVEATTADGDGFTTIEAAARGRDRFDVVELGATGELAAQAKRQRLIGGDDRTGDGDRCKHTNTPKHQHDAAAVGTIVEQLDGLGAVALLLRRGQHGEGAVGGELQQRKVDVVVGVEGCRKALTGSNVDGEGGIGRHRQGAAIGLRRDQRHARVRQASAAARRGHVAAREQLARGKRFGGQAAAPEVDRRRGRLDIVGIAWSQGTIAVGDDLGAHALTHTSDDVGGGDLDRCCGQKRVHGRKRHRDEHFFARAQHDVRRTVGVDVEVEGAQAPAWCAVAARVRIEQRHTNTLATSDLDGVDAHAVIGE